MTARRAKKGPTSPATSRRSAHGRTGRATPPAATGAGAGSRRRAATAVVREPLRERAYRLLREQIVSNALPPGFQALEDEFARRLRMSRTPVREALLKLQTDGMVRVEPRRGATVLPIAPSDLQHIYQVVTAIETAAVELAARRRLDAAALAPLATAVRDMETALAAGDRKAWARADDAFHELLLALSGNPRLAGIGQLLRDHVRRARLATLHQRASPVKSNAAHRATYEAIARGDPVAARELHRAQRERVSDELATLLRDYPLPYL